MCLRPHRPRRRGDGPLLASAARASRQPADLAVAHRYARPTHRMSQPLAAHWVERTPSNARVFQRAHANAHASMCCRTPHRGTLTRCPHTLASVFETYQKARVAFVQKVAELAVRPQNIDALQDAGVMRLLRPLLLDIVSAPLFSSPLLSSL